MTPTELFLFIVAAGAGIFVIGLGLLLLWTLQKAIVGWAMESDTTTEQVAAALQETGALKNIAQNEPGA